ncbi:MAG: haloacid dehalogenase-like hydrolase [Dactylosporangium sp.]|nr:haloacid dehalogenase-like hydrolase [Dactylosporangium sp.]
MSDPATDLRLVLWDIDHTLIETRGVGSQFYQAAFEEVTGRTLEHKADVTGKTEQVILAETLRLHGIDQSAAYQEGYARALAEQYRRNADLLRERGRALPGAAEAVASLAQHPGVVQTVLTGNYRAVAAIKLEIFDLDKHIDLDVGAYGEDSTDRPPLVAIAQQRASTKYRHEFTQTNTVIIGDNSHDITAGHLGGAAVIAVASGRDSAEQLRNAGARVVLPDLTGTTNVVAAVLGVTRSASRP